MKTSNGNSISTSDVPLSLAIGVSECTVTYRNSKTEPVLLRTLPIRRLQEFVECVQKLDEARKIELYCDKPVGWADTLSIESLKEVSRRGWELNKADFFWFIGQQRELAAQLKSDSLAAEVLPSTSPTSPQSAE